MSVATRHTILQEAAITKHIEIASGLAAAWVEINLV
jgi:hypothetical protein